MARRCVWPVAGLSGAATLNASNSGAIEISGNYDNVSGTPITVDAAGGSISLLSGSALRNLPFNATAGTDLQIPSGTFTMQSVVLNTDLTQSNNSLVNSFDGLTLNGTATINAPTSATGFQFLNDQTLDGAGTFIFNGSGNGVVAEPRLFPANNTTLTVGPNIVVRGGTATIGQAFGSLVFGGTLIADVAGEELVIGGAAWSADQSIQAINAGEVRVFGALDNANAALAIDTAGGELSATGSASFTDVTLNGTAGTELAIPGGTYTMRDVVVNLDVALANNSLVNVFDGMTMNGTATVTAPNSPTGFQFLNTQTLTGTGTFVFNGTGNSVIAEPRLFPANSTILTIDSGITVRGGNATIGQAFATLNFGGTLISESDGEELVIGGSLWTADQVLQATGGGELRFFGNLNNGGNPITLDAPGSVTSVTTSAALRNVTVNGTAGTEVEFRSGTTTLENVTINADTRHVNTALTNVFSGLTLNGTATIVAPTSPTGLQFSNSQSLLGTATIVFDSAGNSVIGEPRLFPANSTVLTIGPNIAIEGATATIGNAFATLILNGSVNASVSGEPMLITGAWSGSGSVSATNGGELRLGGTLDNGGGAINVDTGGGSLNVQSSTNLRNATIAGAAGTNVSFNSGGGTLQNLIVNADMTLVNGALLNVTDGLTLNGTAIIDAPTSNTGFTFTNTQTLGGTGTVIIDGVGNSQISEPRLFPANSTTLTIGSGITVRGGKGRVGQTFASVVVNGTISSDVENMEVLGGSVTNNGRLEALNGTTLTVDNIVAGGGGELHAGAGSEVELLDGYTMLASSITSIDIDDPLGTGPGVDHLDGRGELQRYGQRQCSERFHAAAGRQLPAREPQ